MFSWKRIAPVVAISLVAFAATAGADEDNWRRTAHGWEKADAWLHQPAVASRSATLSSIRWDVHPAALLLVQVATVLAAMLLFPRPNSPLPSWLEENCIVSLQRSFRASIFGS